MAIGESAFGALTIRCARPEDAAVLVKWWNDGAVMAHAGFPNGLGTTVSKVRERIARGRLFIIEHAGVPVGEMNYREITPERAEIGIKICESDRQNRGLGRILLSMFLSSLFEEGGYSVIALDTNLQNLRARHVYELLGFRKLRVNRDSWTDQLGRLQSSVDYELTQETFVDFRKAPGAEAIADAE